MEMCDRLKEGQEVTMLFGGHSMLPLISGEGDKIRLKPLAEGEACQPGEVYLFLHNNHFIIHRLLLNALPLNVWLVSSPSAFPSTV